MGGLFQFIFGGFKFMLLLHKQKQFLVLFICPFVSSSFVLAVVYFGLFISFDFLFSCFRFCIHPCVFCLLFAIAHFLCLSTEATIQIHLICIKKNICALEKCVLSVSIYF